MLGIVPFISAAVLCFVAIKLLKGVCLRYGHVDLPGDRKRHDEPTPLCGGFAIGLAFLLVGAATTLFWDYAGLCGGLLMLAAFGTIDDVHNIPAYLRLGIQALVVLVGMVGLGGVTVSTLGALFGATPLILGWLAVPFTIVAVVGLLNSINMIDGVDGLAGGFSLLVFLIFAGALAGNANPAILCIFIGAVAAFLAFNMRTPWRRRASVFLGDAGSLMLGFALAWYAVTLSQGQSPALRPITMVWLFGLPLADTACLMITRAVRHSNPMRADRRHFHHLLFRFGLSVSQVCGVWLGVAALFMLAGLLGEWAGLPEAAMFYGFCAVFGVYCIFNMLMWSHLAEVRSTKTWLEGTGQKTDQL